MSDSIANTAPALIGEAPAFQEMLQLVSRLAPIDRPVVVTGERGTGKELVAARLHYLSNRWDGPLVKVNCAALSESLLDAELFGHEAGAFTGAARRRIGRFEAADGGTLFLDEIATASLQVQEKILRAVEYGAFERLGSSETRTVDARVIAAANADLPALAARGQFRADLLDRLSFAVVTVPPLRARPEDIAALADHFAIAMTRQLSRAFFPGFAPETLRRLMDHPWPGNVRELRNVVERAVALSDDPEEPIADVTLDPFNSPWSPSPAPGSEPEQPTAPQDFDAPRDFDTPRDFDPPRDFDAAVTGLERELLRQALTTARFNQKDAAARLGLTYHRFRHLLRKHGIK